MVRLGLGDRTGAICIDLYTAFDCLPHASLQTTGDIIVVRHFSYNSLGCNVCLWWNNAMGHGSNLMDKFFQGSTQGSFAWFPLFNILLWAIWYYPWIVATFTILQIMISGHARGQIWMLLDLTLNMGVTLDWNNFQWAYLCVDIESD